MALAPLVAPHRLRADQCWRQPSQRGSHCTKTSASTLRSGLQRQNRAMSSNGAQWQPVCRLADAVAPAAVVIAASANAHLIRLALAATGAVSTSPAVVAPAIAVTITLAETALTIGALWLVGQVADLSIPQKLAGLRTLGEIGVAVSSSPPSQLCP